MRRMKSNLTRFGLIVCCYLTLMLPTSYLQAQVAINTNGAEPDTSAILDISSNEKGLLIPRMDSTARKNISGPAQGLMIYDSTSQSFWYFKDTVWNEINEDPFPDGGTTGQLLTTNGNDSLYWGDIVETQNLTFWEDSLSITIGDTIDLSSLRDITTTGVFFSSYDLDETLDISVTTQNNSIGQAAAQWQSFTPTVSGLLTKIDVNVSNFGAGGKFRVYSGEGTGGELLLEIDSISLSSGWNTIDVEAYGVALDSGSVYSYWLDEYGGGQQYYTTKANSNNIYDGGRAKYSASWDYLFQVYIKPNLKQQIININTSNNEYKVGLNSIDSIKFSDNSFLTADDENFRLTSGGNIRFTTNGAQRMIINSEGNIGIGSTSPAYPLQIGVSSSGLQLPVLIRNSSSDESGSTAVGIGLVNQWSSFPKAAIAHARTGSWGRGDLHILVDGQTDGNPVELTDIVATFTHSGRLGIGTTNPDYALQVGESGDGSEARANAWNTFSDRRWKKDFEIIPDALKKLDMVNGYYYNWKNSRDESQQIGVIAQEIESILPQAVSTDENGYKSVDYGKLTAWLIQVNKEQQEEIEKLHGQLKELDTLSTKVEELKAMILSKTANN